MEDILCGFTPKCEQEEVDSKIARKYHEMFGDIWTRENELCHLTSSAFIVNEDFTKVLVIYHNIYNSWAWVGGHADGDHDLLHVALKETTEETGLELNQIKVLEKEPVTFEFLPVTSHIKRGKYVAAHIHMNVAFLFQSSESNHIRILEDENSNIMWMTFEDFIAKSKEPHMLPTYNKLINYINKNYKNK